MTEAELSWNCDFCGKAGIIVSQAGILYCKYCRKSYGEVIGYEQMLNDKGFQIMLGEENVKLLRDKLYNLLPEKRK